MSSSEPINGIERVAFPPLGDVQLGEVMRLTDDRFLITGSISAMETENFNNKGKSIHET